MMTTQTPAPPTEADGALTSPTTDAPLPEAGPASMPDLADRFVFLDLPQPALAIKSLARLRILPWEDDAPFVEGEVVLVAAKPGRPVARVEVDGRFYDGEWVEGLWHFTAEAIEAAAREAGWSNVERHGEDRWWLT